MKHKHYDMIVAKAENRKLIVFTKNKATGNWNETGAEHLFFDDLDLFLCLPEHKEACLHWLNGGDAQAMDNNWVNLFPVENYPWEEEHDFMDVEAKIRIKPKKEKRWVVIDNFGKAVPNLLKDEQSLENAKELMPDCSFHEIEVEV